MSISCSFPITRLCSSVERKLSDGSDLQLKMLKLYQTGVEPRVFMPEQTAMWVSKFVLLSKQKRYKQNPWITGKLTDDYSVTDILHNQCTVQLREENLWNLGPYNQRVGHHILRHLRSQNTVKAGLILSNFILRNFALTWLENLQHFSNLCDNFWFNVMWHNDSWLHISSVGG